MKYLKPIQKGLTLLALSAAAAANTGCGKQSVSMQLGGYTLASAGLSPATQMAQQKNEMEKRFSLTRFLNQTLTSLLTSPSQPAKASISEIQMCFKRLRFKLQDDSYNDDGSFDSNGHSSNHHNSHSSSDDSNDNNEDNIDFNLGLVTLDSSGTGLGTVQLVPGNYRRVEFDLDNDCAGSNGNSLLIEDNGSFASQDGITIKFEGNFILGQEDAVLSLSIQNIMTALATETADGIASSKALKDAAEDASGSF